MSAPLREIDPNAPLRAQVVEKLEELLGRARTGEFTSMLFVGETRGGTFVHTYTGTTDRHTQIAQLEILKAILVQRCLEG